MLEIVKITMPVLRRVCQETIVGCVIGEHHWFATGIKKSWMAADKRTGELLGGYRELKVCKKCHSREYK